MIVAAEDVAVVSKSKSNAFFVEDKPADHRCGFTAFVGFELTIFEALTPPLLAFVFSSCCNTWRRKFRTDRRLSTKANGAITVVATDPVLKACSPG